MALLAATMAGCVGEDAANETTPATTNDLAAAPPQPEPAQPPQLLVQAHSDHLRLLDATAGTETYSARAGQPVLLDAGASRDPGGGDLAFAWYYQGALVADGPLWAYAFHDTGDHVLSLEVTSEAGLTRVHSMLFVVSEAPAADTARDYAFQGRYAGTCSSATGEPFCAGDAVEHRFQVPAGARELWVAVRDDDRAGAFAARLYAPDGSLEASLDGGELGIQMVAAGVTSPPVGGPSDVQGRERWMVVTGDLAAGEWMLHLASEDGATAVHYEALASTA